MEKAAWGLFLSGEPQKAAEHARSCASNNAPETAGCTVLLGVIASDAGSYDSALRYFDLARPSLAMRQETGADWDRFLMKFALKREGLSHYKLEKYNKAAASLQAFDGLRDDDEKGFDVYSEMLAMSMFRTGDVAGAAAYLEPYASDRASGEEYCWVTYNLSAMRAKQSQPQQSIDAARKHVSKCDKRQFAKDVKDDADFSSVRELPEFLSVVSSPHQ